MSWFFRLLGGMIRTVVTLGLVAVMLLVGLAYLDSSGIAQGKVDRVLADTVSPRVATVVENGGLLDQAGDLLRGLLSQVDQALGNGVLALSAPEGAVQPDQPVEADSQALLAEQLLGQQLLGQQLLGMINEYRAVNGLRPWKWDGRLAAFAQLRADDMVARSYFSHTDPRTGEILLAELPTLVSVGENLFQVSGPAVRFMHEVNADVLRGWQNSPSHNELLLARTMTRGGLAFARTETRIVAVLIAAE